MKVEEAINELKYEWDYMLEGTDLKGREKEEAERNEDFRKVYQANMMAIKALEIIRDLKNLPITCTTQFKAYTYHKILELEEVENEIND